VGIVVLDSVEIQRGGIREGRKRWTINMKGSNGKTGTSGGASGLGSQAIGI